MLNAKLLEDPTMMMRTRILIKVEKLNFRLRTYLIKQWLLLLLLHMGEIDDISDTLSFNHVILLVTL